MKRIPVSIITGFLGAGKTTLLNHLVQSNPDTKFAIIENEFGEIGIDNELVINSNEGIFEMSNGCICCSLNEELVETLVKLIDYKENIDHLLIETTGIAEPDGIAQVFLGAAAIQQHFRLDGTICLCDAINIEDMLKEREEARKQLSFADYVVLNKTEALSEKMLQKLEAKLKEQNPFASVEFTSYSKVGDKMLKLNSYETDKLEKDFERPHHHHHSSDLQAHSYEYEVAFDFIKFMHWAKVLTLIQGKEIYRIKGVMNFAFHEHKMIFQSVRSISGFKQGSKWDDKEKRRTRIVFIAKGIKWESLDKAMKKCLAAN